MLKDGKVFADGNRAEIFTSEKISDLFDLKVELIENKGISQIVLKDSTQDEKMA
jgi:ABC-type cobalamin/Fe3+-siderophores transport system ATPase subunit